MRVLAAGLLLALLLLQGRLWFGDGSIPDTWRLQRDVDEQAAQNASLEERNRALAADVADLKNGLEAVEERARRELGMIGENERFYQIVAPRER